MAAHQTGLVNRPKCREELLQLLLAALLSVESLEFYAKFLRLHVGVILLLLAGRPPPVHPPNQSKDEQRQEVECGNGCLQQGIKVGEGGAG